MILPSRLEKHLSFDRLTSLDLLLPCCTCSFPNSCVSGWKADFAYESSKIAEVETVSSQDPYCCLTRLPHSLSQPSIGRPPPPSKTCLESGSRPKNLWIDMIVTKKPSWNKRLLYVIPTYMAVSKNRGTPKWMVHNGKPYYNGMIWGYHYFWKHPYIGIYNKEL